MLPCTGFSLRWLLLLQSTGSRLMGSVVLEHGLSCLAACGILLDQGLNPVSPALADGHLTAGPPGKSQICMLDSSLGLCFKIGQVNMVMMSDLSYLICRCKNAHQSRCIWGTAAAKSLQSCPTLCDPVDSSPPGSPIPGILQARTLEWVAISSSNA